MEYLSLIGEYRVSTPSEYVSIVPDAEDVNAIAAMSVLRKSGHDAPKLVTESEDNQHARYHREAPEAWFFLIPN